MSQRDIELSNDLRDLEMIESFFRKISSDYIIATPAIDPKNNKKRCPYRQIELYYGNPSSVYNKMRNLDKKWFSKLKLVLRPGLNPKLVDMFRPFQDIIESKFIQYQSNPKQNLLKSFNDVAKLIKEELFKELV